MCKRINWKKKLDTYNAEHGTSYQTLKELFVGVYLQVGSLQKSASHLGIAKTTFVYRLHQVGLDYQSLRGVSLPEEKEEDQIETPAGYYDQYIPGDPNPCLMCEFHLKKRGKKNPVCDKCNKRWAYVRYLENSNDYPATYFSETPHMPAFSEFREGMS